MLGKDFKEVVVTSLLVVGGAVGMIIFIDTFSHVVDGMENRSLERRHRDLQFMIDNGYEQVNENGVAVWRKTTNNNQ
jgi:hypothetical protein